MPVPKAYEKLLRTAGDQLREAVSKTSDHFSKLPPAVQNNLIRILRPLAHKKIADALEGRTAAATKIFGQEWDSALAEMEVHPQRRTALRAIEESIPETKNLENPKIFRRLAIEWLYAQTVDRIETVTPYLRHEEEALKEWQKACPNAYDTADRVAQKAVQSARKRASQPNAVPITEKALALLHTAYLIGARKLYLQATNTRELFKDNPATVSLKLSPDLQQKLQSRGLFVRLGKADPIRYASQVDESRLALYRQLVVNGNSPSNLLRNLQQTLCPWTADNNLNTKLNANIMAQIYYDVYKPAVTQPTKGQPDADTLKALNSLEMYQALGFRDDIAPAHAQSMGEFLDSNPDLQSFLAKPSVQKAFREHRLDQTWVEMATNTVTAHELVEVARKWKPEIIAGNTLHERAEGLIEPICEDLREYYQQLLNGDYLSARDKNFYREVLTREQIATLPPKDAAKLNGTYKPKAVVLLASDDQFSGKVPETWKPSRTYIDNVTHKKFTDYNITLPEGDAIICLAQGADPTKAAGIAAKLLDIEQPPTINNKELRAKGVRLSELSYNELRNGSCLYPHTIARMQFYTSYRPSDTLKLLVGSKEEPSIENAIEVLRPCLILRYDDTYCRIKPVEKASENSPKYRTATAERLRENGLSRPKSPMPRNPCWDASSILSGISGRKPGGLPQAALQARFDDPTWPLILIEGEKKAALLAQMCLDVGFKAHVVALPGVWMGRWAERVMEGGRSIEKLHLVEELQQFNLKGRNVVIFFDNDKAYKVGVTDALLDLTHLLQKEQAHVFCANLPFGKRLKGADDFVAHTSVTPEGEIDYRPLQDIIENAVLIPAEVKRVKYLDPALQKEIEKNLDVAEEIDELQHLIRKQANPALCPELRELYIKTALHRDGIKEAQAAQVFDGLSNEDKQELAQKLLQENSALKKLKQASRQIPSFTTGTTLKQAKEGILPKESQFVLTPELFF